jgi:4-hydroxybenzoate polyprenyltransferase
VLLLIWFGVLTHAGVFWLGCRGGLRVRLRALARQAERPVPPQPRVLQVNGFVGIALFCFALLDLLVRGLRG